jgi:hypothetical protein
VARARVAGVIGALEIGSRVALDVIPTADRRSFMPTLTLERQSQ